MKPLYVTLYFIEFVHNNLGIWDREWFLTQPEAQAAYEAKLEEGFTPKDTGDEGALRGPCQHTVELSAQGLLRFANRFAVDDV